MYFQENIQNVESVISLNLIETKIDENNYHIYKYSESDKNEYFFIIEGREKQSFSNFRKSCEAIIIAFAFTSGPLVQHQNFYQSSDDSEFKNIENIFFEKKHSNLLNKRPIINPSDFKRYIRELDNNIKEKYKEFSNPFSYEIFSTLCNSIKNNNVYARCCQLVIESHNTKRYLLKAGILSIALETITTLVYEENKEKIKPISDKKIAKNLRQDLLMSCINTKKIFLKKRLEFLPRKLMKLIAQQIQRN